MWLADARYRGEKEQGAKRKQKARREIINEHARTTKHCARDIKNNRTTGARKKNEAGVLYNLNIKAYRIIACE